MRIDKLLADAGIGSRSEIKKILKAGLVKVNNQIVKNADHKVTPDSDNITCRGEIVRYRQNEYFMLNKPAGYVSATRDNVYPTVMELLPDAVPKDLFPVGRLDADTEGLLLITNDGQLSHNLLSPKKHVDKVYYAKIQGIVSAEDIAAFSSGLDIGEAALTLPAKLNILSIDPLTCSSEITVALHEGKFHQVKRMFHAVGKEVTYLKRTAMGPLALDDTLAPGQCRELTAEEVQTLLGSPQTFSSRPDNLTL